MADKKIQQDDVDVVQRARGFWANYNKPVMYIASAIIILLGGWLVYKYMFKIPAEEKANDSIFITQKYFSDFSNAPSDSTKALMAAKVLNGDGVNAGALKIISKYSGTDAANLSEYYAGASYLHLKQYDKAIKYLKDFNAHGATQIKSRALGMMGDASAELKKNDDALDYYKKAADVDDKDEFTSSEFLFRAALFAEVTGKTKDAIELFKKIKDQYPLSEKAADVDRYLAKLGEFSE
ncbi:MAG: tetratricopeptide repeat protein [Bacteroidota bacterium]|nr:tetratricopeptide repeat protein [Bacteroidota bacterium]